MRRAARLFFPILLVVAVSGACGSTTPSSSVLSGPGAQIKANWQKFFAGSSTAAQREALLQNGQQFASLISSVISNSVVQSASATVHSVDVSGSTAAVRYDLDFQGAPVLSNQTGTAVLQDGTWKVSLASFCALIQLVEAPPAACSG